MSDMAMSPSERMEWNGATCWIYHHPPCYILSMGRMKCVTLEFLSFPPTFPNRELFVRRGGEKGKERDKRQRWNNKLCVFLPPKKKEKKLQGVLGLEISRLHLRKSFMTFLSLLLLLPFMLGRDKCVRRPFFVLLSLSAPWCCYIGFVRRRREDTSFLDSPRLSP